MATVVVASPASKVDDGVKRAMRSTAIVETWLQQVATPLVMPIRHLLRGVRPYRIFPGDVTIV